MESVLPSSFSQISHRSLHVDTIYADFLQTFNLISANLTQKVSCALNHSGISVKFPRRRSNFSLLTEDPLKRMEYDKNFVGYLIA